jgi:hypothetical protein
VEVPVEHLASGIAPAIGKAETGGQSAYLLVLLALADTGVKESLPVITIQAN